MSPYLPSNHAFLFSMFCFHFLVFRSLSSVLPFRQCEMRSESKVKLLLIAVIFLFGFSGVLTPRLFNSKGNNLKYANLFSSGVLLAAALIHLLPDAVNNIHIPAFQDASTGRGVTRP